jgi:hypothetical protein
MQDAVDFNDFCADSVYGQKGQTWEYQFASIQLAARTTTVRKLREGANAFVDCEGYTPGGCRAVMFLDVVADVGEIAR